MFTFTNPMSGLIATTGMQTRSCCPENPTGEVGKGAMATVPQGVYHAASTLGQGWKVNPCTGVKAGETLTLMDVKGPGIIQHIWMTLTGIWRNQILRIYWDDSPIPSVQCPAGDFFGCGWGEFAPLNSLAMCVNPGSAFNCYFQMPFKKSCRMTLENRNNDQIVAFYQITYALGAVPENIAYFHAQFHRSNPLPYMTDHTLLDNVVGEGHYVGTYLAWGVNNRGWWGEGEIKFFMDGDKQFPTICGTGTEDYFCGSYNFENKITKQYQEYCTPYAGLCQVIRPNAVYDSQMRFGMYRWHITDPICFTKDLKVTIQALGWRKDGRYLPLQDDIASVAYWYQTTVNAVVPTLPDRDYLEVI